MVIVDKSTPLHVGHACQIFLCLYGARYSYVAITKLRKYEETSKKLAEWSKTVEDHLNKTRTTQATGVLCLLTSLVGALTLLCASQYMPWPVNYIISPTFLVAILAARTHIKNYWAPYNDADGKDVGTRVPLPNMGEYNEAEEMTERLLEVLQYLEYSWLATSLFTGLGFHY